MSEAFIALVPLPCHSCVPGAHISLPTHQDTWTHARTLSRGGCLGKSLLGGAHSSAAGKTVPSRGTKAATEAPGSTWDTQASCRYLQALWTKHLVFCQQNFWPCGKKHGKLGITLIFFSLKHKLFFLKALNYDLNARISTQRS